MKNIVALAFSEDYEDSVMKDKKTLISCFLKDNLDLHKNIFIEYPKCTTCKKAKKWLEENGIEFTERNIVTETPTIKELMQWTKEYEQELKKWFNTSGLKYKELNLKEKLITMTNKEKIELLASDGMLIKRPILISDKGIFIGFKEELWKNIITK